MNSKPMLAPSSAETEPLSKRLRYLYRRKTVVDDLIRTLVKYDRASRRLSEKTFEE